MKNIKSFFLGALTFQNNGNVSSQNSNSCLQRVDISFIYLFILYCEINIF